MIAVLSWGLAVPATLACTYLLILTLFSRRPSAPEGSSRTLFFDVIVPAHNEAAHIAATVDNLQSIDWPKDRYRIVVMADNCTDNTATLARNAGATVIERHNDVDRGKGYALAEAFRWSRIEGRADAVAVIDADSLASLNLLESFAVRIERGASAIQAHYGVLNAAASWRTRLMAIALGAIHKLRSRAREALALSCGIRGNGWCVTHSLLSKVPYRAFSLTEDVEFGVQMGLAGYRVHYGDESSVDGEMVTTASAARSQRQRWEGGRLALIRQQVPQLLEAAVARRSILCLDLAIDLLILPLSYVVLNVAALGVLCVFNASASAGLLESLCAFNAIALVAYVCRGWILSGVGIRGFWDLLRVPVFLAWKIALLVSGSKATSWVRTKREGS